MVAFENQQPLVTNERYLNDPRKPSADREHEYNLRLRLVITCVYLRWICPQAGEVCNRSTTQTKKDASGHKLFSVLFALVRSRAQDSSKMFFFSICFWFIYFF